jgi:hypothetical protein
VITSPVATSLKIKQAIRLNTLDSRMQEFLNRMNSIDGDRSNGMGPLWVDV